MIVKEWIPLLEGKEDFQDEEVRQIVQHLLDKISGETNPIKILEYNNDLELLLGSGEWLTRKYNRIELILSEIPIDEERKVLEEKLVRIKARRDEVVAKIKAKYGL